MKNPAVALLLLCIACDLSVSNTPSAFQDDGTSGSDSGGETANPTTTTTGDGTTAGPSTSTGGGDEPGSTFIVETTAAADESEWCDTLSQQDCPADEKCVPWWSVDQSEYINHCVAVHPQPQPVGAPCRQFGEYGEDGDDCELGALCWDPDPVTGIGMCVELCTGTQESAHCTTPNTFCSYGKSIQICLQTCEPRDLETCPVGCTCVPSGDVSDAAFMCMLNASGDLGVYADPCEFPNACDPGLLCLDSALSPDCDPSVPGCCLPVCDTGAPECPDPDLVCTPWFEDGSAPPQFETLGACMLPQ